MVNVLLSKIKELETELKNIKTSNKKVKEELLDVFKKCKINKDEKEAFKSRFLKILSKLEVKNIENFYDEMNSLKYRSFLEIISHFNNGYLLIIDLNVEEEKKPFIAGYIVNKISPFCTINNEMLLCLLDEKDLKKIKNVNEIPYFDPKSGEYTDINLYKIVFDIENFDAKNIEKAKTIFTELRKRPSFKHKKYIEYSLIKNKVIDFIQEERNKQKEKFAFIYDEKYPNLEIKIKKEINNIPFVLALLERIDKEIEIIKDSKGILNIVNRILNYIEMNQNDASIRDEVRFLRNKLIN